ncbi:histidine phosphatase family protein [Paenibacillus barcinonensis]|uniref:histidine phosphatase family protein n=1 Tax=Paenibacillus TaxID=44249 RepID=UPI001C11A4E6|nr:MULTISPECIES: histidine phosphatase family protein [Paenibacillus]MBU5352075.1 histidine phosphatase family protein [Paenibacillus barcinonensis]MDM5277288.1 histidine phosphatase family protein [Paenibacillus silvae]
MATLGLIRHGATDWNGQYRAQGRTDIPLNAEGRRQAELLSERIRSERWHYIYTSDLSRAMETSVIIGEVNGIEIRVDERLREMDCGQIEGTTEQERVNQWGYGWSRLDLGIEPHEAVVKRGRECFADLAERHSDQNILIVSHGALLGLTLKRLLAHIDIRENLSNTSLTLLHSVEPRWDCSLYNCTKHLTGSPSSFI